MSASIRGCLGLNGEMSWVSFIGDGEPRFGGRPGRALKHGGKHNIIKRHISSKVNSSSSSRSSCRLRGSSRRITLNIQHVRENDVTVTTLF